jgi:GNAT superfamily N-acetyltransferase
MNKIPESAVVMVRPVASRRDLKAFIRFPHGLYRGNPFWVPNLDFDEWNTLRQEKNPAFDHCQAKYWLAFRQGRIVGRIAAILNRKHIAKWNQRYMRFGWADFIDDAAVSAALFSAVEAWARECGMEAVHGPLGFSDMDREGMLVEGFDERATMITNYNFPYYSAHLEAMGYGKDSDWLEYDLTVPPEADETIARIAAIALRRNHLHLLQARRTKDLLPYAHELFRLLDEEYKNLYGVVPLTAKQVDQYISQYLGFIRPEFVPVVLDESNRMVAFGITMPSLARALQKAKGRLLPFGFIHVMRALRKNDRAELYLVAVRSAYQGKGVNAILMDEMNRLFIRRGIRRVESNPELETNQNVRGQWKHYPARQHKRRRVFIKRLV